MQAIINLPDAEVGIFRYNEISSTVDDALAPFFRQGINNHGIDYAA